jgi:hypothetical protein
MTTTRVLLFLLVMTTVICLASCSRPANQAETPQRVAKQAPPPKAGDRDVYKPLEGGNTAPEIKKAELVADSADSLHVTAEAADADGDKVSLKYAWTVNGTPVSQDASITGLKSGDKVLVKVIPSDGAVDGPAKTLFMIIQNLPPRFLQTGNPVFDDPVWTYHVKAEDPDGDKVTYKLVSGPEGMTVNPNTGTVQWNAGAFADGKYSATVAAVDSRGATSETSFEIRLGTEGKGNEGKSTS